ncbi:hypothetical protein HGRIS_002812 [Hohenbuehelia grisea]|uniref:F-box domain-containing protein n=1 Tax=Hohenbuehelia grisea TaxID=104357 RepID=A0ABR3JLM2_9AGAR
MRAEGYKVYRHNGRYIVHYIQFDSTPEGVGREILSEIPRNLEAYERWAERLRTEIDAYKEPEGNEDGDDPDWPEIHDDQPVNSLFIAWVYEIDLDHEVFHVNSQPIFNLRNMPDVDIFLQGISFDEYRHRAYDESLPKEYRYDWKATPPAPDSASLNVYDLHCASVALLEMDRLLELASKLTPCEQNDRGLETAKEVADIPKGLAGLGRDLVVSALGPMIFRDFPGEADPSPKQLSVGWDLLDRLFAGNPKPAWQVAKGKATAGDMTWVHPSVCLHIALHLDAEPNLKAAIGELVQFVKEDTVKQDLDRGPVVYGVVTSLFHSALVKIDISRDYTFHHTPALQLLPSFYATSPSTPGLTALIRLGCSLPYPDILTQVIERHPFLQKLAQVEEGSSAQGRTRFDEIPPEMIIHIGSYLTDPVDLARFALTGHHVRAVMSSMSSDLLRWPFVEGARLVDPIEPLDTYEAGSELWSSSFRAQDSKGSLIVQIGEEPATSGKEFVEKSFKVRLGIDEVTLRCFLEKSRRNYRRRQQG